MAVKPTAPPNQAGPKKRTVSEIDDIFAKKPSASTSTPPTALPTSDEPRKKKKKSKARPSAEAIEDVEMDIEPAPVASTSKRVPETIVDTSKQLDSYRVVAPTAAAAAAASSVAGKKRKAAEGEAETPIPGLADEDFMDSRGANRRRTEDGMAIYDIAELRIGLGGDTELCPFDCQCCF